MAMPQSHPGEERALEHASLTQHVAGAHVSSHASTRADEARDVLKVVAVQSVAVHSRVTGCALVVRCAPALDRAGRPYLLLTLRGADGGHIEARWWRYPYPVERRPAVGQLCWVCATCEEYEGERQLSILRAHPAPPTIEVATFLRTTHRSGEDLRAELNRRVTNLDTEMAALVRAVLSLPVDDTVNSEDATQHHIGRTVYERFCTWPAARRWHGACRHGLLAHSLQVARIAERLGGAYGRESIPHDSQLVTAACLLHDVGKIYTLPAIAEAAPPAGASVFDHVTRGVLMIASIMATMKRPSIAPGRFQHLLHAVLTHHGHKEWGAPVEPQTVEAWLVHLADLAESRLWAWSSEEEGTAR